MRSLLCRTAMTIFSSLVPAFNFLRTPTPSGAVVQRVACAQNRGQGVKSPGLPRRPSRSRRKTQLTSMVHGSTTKVRTSHSQSSQYMCLRLVCSI